jgi:hypothetical protein
MRLGAAFLFAAAAAVPAAAELKLTPSVSLREEYNDNIELTRDNRIDDFITSVTPALGISWKTSILELSADYGLNFRIFAKNSGRNETDLTEAQMAKADTTLTVMPEALFVKLSDVFERVPVDERDQVALDNIFVNLSNSNRFTANPYLDYPVSPTLRLLAGYTYQNTWYDDPRGDDSEDHTATGGITKQFGERLSVFGNYSYRWHRPSRTLQYDNQTGTVGAALQLTTKLSVSGSVGQTFYRYEGGVQRVRIPVTVNGTLGDVPVPPRETSATIWNAKANYLLTERLSLGAGYSQSFSDSVTEGSARSRSITGSVTYKVVDTLPMTVAGFSTNSTFLITNREDRSTGVTVSAPVPLTPRLTARLDGGYTRFEFLPEGEEANRYSARVGLDYQFAVTTVGFGYTWNRNDSTVDTKDYTNNIAFVQAKFTF